MPDTKAPRHAKASLSVEIPRSESLDVENLCEEKATTDITVVSAILEKYSESKEERRNTLKLE